MHSIHVLLSKAPPISIGRQFRSLKAFLTKILPRRLPERQYRSSKSTLLATLPGTMPDSLPQPKSRIVIVASQEPVLHLSKEASYRVSQHERQISLCDLSVLRAPWSQHLRVEITK